MCKVCFDTHIFEIKIFITYINNTQFPKSNIIKFAVMELLNNSYYIPVKYKLSDAKYFPLL